jgi:hypothetical protein
MVTRFDQVIGGVRSPLDYKQAKEQFEQNKLLKQAQINKAMQPAPVNVNKLGQEAFLKAAQGIDLTERERAAAKFLDAKSGGVQFDPITGAMVQKPSLIDKIPLDKQTVKPVELFGATEEVAQAPQETAMPTPPIESQSSEVGFFERGMQEQLEAAKDNPKLQQQIRLEYAKARMKPGVDESKAAGFADRMLESGGIIAEPKKTSAALDPLQRVLDEIPVLGNYVVSDDYQSFSQAQRDFINAQLRRESGAVISPEEFKNAERQYFPTPGDSPQVIKQKENNRQIAIDAMVRSAGASYTKPVAKSGARKEMELQQMRSKLSKAGFSKEEIAEYLKSKGL